MIPCSRGWGGIPLVVPTHFGVTPSELSKIDAFNSKWETVTLADVYYNFTATSGGRLPPAIDHFFSILNAYRDRDVAKFNGELRKYRAPVTQAAGRESLPLERGRLRSLVQRF